MQIKNSCFEAGVFCVLYLSCGKLYEVHYIVGLHFRFVCRFVAVNFAAFRAFVKDDIPLFRVCNDFDGAHYAVTFARSVAGVYVYVERAEALGAMVARGIAERFYLKATVCTDKAIIVFCKKLLFHKFSFIQKATLGWLL